LNSATILRRSFRRLLARKAERRNLHNIKQQRAPRFRGALLIHLDIG